MDTVNIFIAGPDGDRFADFKHGATRYVFSRLHPDGPRRLVDGRMCVFIYWVLEDLSGLEMCRRLRADPRTGDAHITLVLEEDDAEAKRRALRAGADDYLLGPVARAAVLDRVLAMQNGLVTTSAMQVLVKGSLEIDIAALQARWAGAAIALRPNEFRLLRFFAENPDRVLTRHELIEGLGKQNPAIDERTVDVWIGRLRRALRRAGAGEPVRTIRALGYAFDSH